MTFSSTGRNIEEYYQTFIELQERLRKSEEERLQLEMKFNTMIQVTQEEEQLYFKRLKTQYRRFMEENQKRQERNDQIMQMLDRIESRAAIFEAKSKRFKLLRNQYQSFLTRIEHERNVEDMKEAADTTLKHIIDSPASLPKAGGSVGRVKLKIRENSKPHRRHDLASADQLLARFKEQSNEAAIADDIMRCIYERNRMHRDFNDFNARNVTVEDDTDDSTTSVVGETNLKNPNCRSAELLKTIVANGETRSNINTINTNDAECVMENSNNSNQSVDENQNSWQTFNPDQNKENTNKMNGDMSEDKQEIEAEQDETIAIDIDDKTPAETKQNENNEIRSGEEENNSVSEPIQIPTNGQIELNTDDLQNNDQSPLPVDNQQTENAEEREQSNVDSNNQPMQNALQIDNRQEENITEEQEYPENVETVSSQEQIIDNEIAEANQYENPDALDGNLEQSYPTHQAEEQQDVGPVQYDESGQPIQYDENNRQIYYDENGQPMHYDENTQEYKYNEQQYDENGQPTNYDNYQNYQYDENGQIVDYAQQGQPEYDENGQLIGYAQEQQSAPEEIESEPNAPTEGGNNYFHDEQKLETNQEPEMTELLDGNNGNNAPKANVLELLDTESESTPNPNPQGGSKEANESDFEFSSTSDGKDQRDRVDTN